MIVRKQWGTFISSWNSLVFQGKKCSFEFYADSRKNSKWNHFIFVAVAAVEEAAAAAVAAAAATAAVASHSDLKAFFFFLIQSKKVYLSWKIYVAKDAQRGDVE